MTAHKCKWLPPYENDSHDRKQLPTDAIDCLQQKTTAHRQKRPPTSTKCRCHVIWFGESIPHSSQPTSLTPPGHQTMKGSGRRQHNNKRSLQCPPNSCRNLVIPVESGGFWRNEIWQEGLVFSSFWCLIIPVEFGHSRIETRMFHRMRRNGMQQNLVVYLFSICLLIICDMSQLSPLLPPPPPPLRCTC